MDFWKRVIVETYKGEKKLLTEFTQEELIYEKVKCATNPIYVIENYFYIFDQTKNNSKGEIVPFILFPFQKDLVNSYEKNRFNITNKYRQAGVSTVTCAYLATYIAFNSNRTVAIVANKLETARDELMKDVTNFIDMLPPFLHPRLSDKDAATHKTYTNGSQVKAFATNSLRGYTPTFLFWDEAAWCDNGEGFWTGTLPSLSTGGNAALVSCVTKDTMVWTDQGLIEISEIITDKIKGPYFIDDYEVLGRDKKRCGNIFKNNGFGVTRKVLSEEVFIEGTSIHKVWLYNNRTGDIGYNKLKHTKVNDYIAIQYGSNSFGKLNEIKFLPKKNRKFTYYNYKLTEKFSDLIVLIYLKGFVTESISNRKPFINLRIENLNDIDISIIKDFLDEYKEIYYKNFEEDKFIFNDDVFTSSSQSVNYIFYFIELAFNPKLDRLNNRNITKFIRRFEGKYLKRFVKTYIKLYEEKVLMDDCFYLKINSITMAKQIQQILINQGIICSYDPTIKIESISKDRFLKVYINYDVYINNVDFDLSLFDQDLPIGIVHNVSEIFKKYDINIPFGIYKRFKLIEIIEKLSELITDKNDLFLIKNYVSKDLYWSKVIEVINNKNITYDFSLPNNPDDFWGHSVLYNGILGHQTPNGLDPVFYKTYNNAKNGMSEFVANELHWYYDPRYSNDLAWKRKNNKGLEIIIKEKNIKKFKNLIADGWKPTSPWYESMASKFNYDKKKISQELECVVGNTIITIKNIETNVIEDIKIEESDSKISNSMYLVLNDKNEFVSFDGVVKHINKDRLKIKTINKEIEVTLSHYLLNDYGEVFASELNIDDFILTKDGYEKITNIEKIDTEVFVYDLVNVADNSLYLTNGIVSHNCSFLGSGNNFIDEEHIRRIEESQIKDPIRMEYDDFFWIWEDPIRDKSYVMSVDVSTGASDDFSSIIILKQHESHLEQVAEFKHKVSPDTLGVIANDYGIRYNNAYAIIDITGGIGTMTMKAMLDLGYNNVHYTVSRHEPTKEKLNDYSKEDDNGKVLVPGFVISSSNRGMILTEMKRAVEANEIEIKSYRLISEFKTFISTTNSRVADHRRSFNDDLVIALAMGVYVFSYDIRSVGMSVEKTKKMLSAMTTITNDYTNDQVVNNSNISVNPSNPYVANNWLFKGLNK